MRPPDAARDGWGLDDAEELAAAHPDSFKIPEQALRPALRPGDHAEPVFRIDVEGDEAAVERMWVVVRERVPDGYSGTVDDEPLLIERDDVPWRGTELMFALRHVIDVRPGTPDSREFASSPLAIPWRRD